ncbi:hypothetical protein LIER_35136 [Lithospermum erythrorhizon]|uniref:Uncharacterized protein n=1 Tax=Lithospermum erythrorhizon TaxID=34254 RepID=A0AAV3NLT4_LITER
MPNVADIGDETSKRRKHKAGVENNVVEGVGEPFAPKKKLSQEANTAKRARIVEWKTRKAARRTLKEHYDDNQTYVLERGEEQMDEKQMPTNIRPTISSSWNPADENQGSNDEDVAVVISKRRKATEKLKMDGNRTSVENKRIFKNIVSVPTDGVSINDDKAKAIEATVADHYEILNDGQSSVIDSWHSEDESRASGKDIFVLITNGWLVLIKSMEQGCHVDTDQSKHNAHKVVKKVAVESTVVPNACNSSHLEGHSEIPGNRSTNEEVWKGKKLLEKTVEKELNELLITVGATLSSTISTLQKKNRPVRSRRAIGCHSNIGSICNHSKEGAWRESRGLGT